MNEYFSHLSSWYQLQKLNMVTWYQRSMVWPACPWFLALLMAWKKSRKRQWQLSGRSKLLHWIMASSIDAAEIEQLQATQIHSDLLSLSPTHTHWIYTRLFRSSTIRPARRCPISISRQAACLSFTLHLAWRPKLAVYQWLILDSSSFDFLPPSKWLYQLTDDLNFILYYSA